MDIALDWAAMRRLYLKVGPAFGSIPEARTELDALLRDAPELSVQGDGYKSFAGVVLAMLTFPNRLLLLDEPEAFLHPAQARVLGRWLAAHAKTRTAQMIVASHSADFLWGIVSANAGATVIRLNRSGAGAVDSALELRAKNRRSKLLPAILSNLGLQGSQSYSRPKKLSPPDGGLVFFGWGTRIRT